MVEVTQRKYFIGGNWKSNGTHASIKELLENTVNKLEFNRDKVGNFAKLIV